MEKFSQIQLESLQALETSQMSPKRVLQKKQTKRSLVNSFLKREQTIEVSYEQEEMANLYLCDKCFQIQLQGTILKDYELNYEKLNYLINVDQSKIKKLLIQYGESFKVFYPDTNFKMALNLTGCLLIFAQIMQIPFQIAFPNTEIDGLNLFQDICFYFFMVDILINFNTAYYDNQGVLITKHKMIIENYLKTWFLVDFVSNIPFEDIYILLSQKDTVISNSYLKILRVARVLRLLKALKLRQLLDNIQDQIQISPIIIFFLQLIKLLLIILSIAHWMSCFFCIFFFSQQESDLWLPGFEAMVGNQFSTWNDQYFLGFYWAIVTMITVGYGDITPKTNDTKIFTIFCMIVGNGIFGYVMNKIATIFQEMELRKEQSNQISKLISYLKKKQLSIEIQVRVKQFLEQFSDKQSEMNQINEDEFISQLSDNLRHQYIKQVQFQVIKKCLNNKIKLGEDFILNMALELESKQYNYKEMLIQENDKNQERYLYFNIDDNLNIKIKKTNTVLNQVDKNQNFGLNEFFTNEQFRYSVETANFCQIYRLSRSQFIKILDQTQFREQKQMFQQIKTLLFLKKNYFENQCFFCKGIDHFFNECDKTFIVLKKKELIVQYNSLQKQRTVFQRKVYKTNSMRLSKKINIYFEKFIGEKQNQNMFKTKNSSYGLLHFRQIVFCHVMPFCIINVSFQKKKIEQSCRDIAENYISFFKNNNLKTFVKKYNSFQKKQTVKQKQIIFKFQQSVSRIYKQCCNKDLQIIQSNNKIHIFSLQETNQRLQNIAQASNVEQQILQMIKTFGYDKIAEIIEQNAKQYLIDDTIQLF